MLLYVVNLSLRCLEKTLFLYLKATPPFSPGVNASLPPFRGFGQKQVPRDRPKQTSEFDSMCVYIYMCIFDVNGIHPLHPSSSSAFWQEAGKQKYLIPHRHDDQCS